MGFQKIYIHIAIKNDSKWRFFFLSRPLVCDISLERSIHEVSFSRAQGTMNAAEIPLPSLDVDVFFHCWSGRISFSILFQVGWRTWLIWRMTRWKATFRRPSFGPSWIVPRWAPPPLPLLPPPTRSSSTN